MDTKDIVNDYITRELLGGRETIGHEDDLLAFPSIDSLGVVGLVAFLEQQFDIAVAPEDVVIENFRTVVSISAYVDSRRG